MAHVRQLARNAVANILLGNPQAVPASPVYPISEVGSRIFPNRPTPIWEAELPCICVYTKSESADTRGSDRLPKFYDRTLIITIEILVQVEAGFDDVVDTIAQKIENLLLYQWRLVDPVSGLQTVDDLLMKGTEIAFVGEDVSNVIASGQITLELRYSTDVTMPTLADNFDSMAVDYDIDAASGDGHEGPEAQDEITDIYTP